MAPGSDAHAIEAVVAYVLVQLVRLFEADRDHPSGQITQLASSVAAAAVTFKSICRKHSMHASMHMEENAGRAARQSSW